MNSDQFICWEMVILCFGILQTILFFKIWHFFRLSLEKQICLEELTKNAWKKIECCQKSTQDVQNAIDKLTEDFERQLKEQHEKMTKSTRDIQIQSQTLLQNSLEKIKLGLNSKEEQISQKRNEVEEAGAETVRRTIREKLVPKCLQLHSNHNTPTTAKASTSSPTVNPEGEEEVLTPNGLKSGFRSSLAKGFYGLCACNSPRYISIRPSSTSNLDKIGKGFLLCSRKGCNSSQVASNWLVGAAFSLNLQSAALLKSDLLLDKNIMKNEEATKYINEAKEEEMVKDLEKFFSDIRDHFLKPPK